MSTGTDLPAAIYHLAEITMSMIDASAVEDICAALSEGQLLPMSTAAIRGSLAHGSPELELQIKRLQELWASGLSDLSGHSLAVALRASAQGIQLERALSPKIQVVWTGPKVGGSFVRATREVVREIVRSATRELLVVGYWLAAREDGEGIIEEFIDLLAEATGRGIALTIVLDERKRVDGTDNRKVLLDVWPRGVPLPRLLTWKLPLDDKHLKLHAKLLAADEFDALVTSANLTWYAMDRNIEMGIRIVGEAASTISQHIKLLDQQGTLQAF